MTPLHLMSRQTFLGWLFLVLGVLLILLAVSPIVVGLLATPRGHGDVSLPFLGFGVGLAIFGAWLLPSSGAPAAVTQIIAVSGPLLNRVPGLSRIGDPTPKPPEAP